jgi:hypothetical protein
MAKKTKKNNRHGISFHFLMIQAAHRKFLADRRLEYERFMATKTQLSDKITTEETTTNQCEKLIGAVNIGYSIQITSKDSSAKCLTPREEGKQFCLAHCQVERETDQDYIDSLDFSGSLKRKFREMEECGLSFDQIFDKVDEIKRDYKRQRDEEEEAMRPKWTDEYGCINPSQLESFAKKYYEDDSHQIQVAQDEDESIWVCLGQSSEIKEWFKDPTKHDVPIDINVNVWADEGEGAFDEKLKYVKF